MKTGNTESELFPLPAALLIEVQAAALAEHRPTDEIVRDAVRLYLERRRDVPAAFESAAEKARAFEAWAHGHASTPLLSEDAIRRESLIRDE